MVIKSSVIARLQPEFVNVEQDSSHLEWTRSACYANTKGDSESAQTCRLCRHQPALDSGCKGLVERRRRVRLRQCASTAGRDHERQDTTLSLRQAIGRAGQNNSECIGDLLRDGPWS
jgi:hypothetical protein